MKCTCELQVSYLLICSLNRWIIAHFVLRVPGLSKALKLTYVTTDAKGQRHLTATVDGRSTAELTLDRDDRIVGGKCGCSYFYTGGLRKGPCRHLQAIRNKVLDLAEGGTTIESWYRRFAN